ncbi:MAG: hypothetical protein KDI79_31585, partial [Anaerolineae bacterium]|nr:hypothetical protein [Anaerolineae bacterium]
MMKHQKQTMIDEQGTMNLSKLKSSSPLIIHHSSFIIVFLLIAIFTVFFSVLSIQQHRAFLTNGL